MRRAAFTSIGALAAAAIVACGGLAADVVARVDDGGDSPDATEELVLLPDAMQPVVDGCGETLNGLDVITTSGKADAFDFATAKTTNISLPECTITSGAAMAVSRTGNYVFADQSGSLFVAVQTNTGWDCTKSLFVSVPTALSFHFDDVTAVEQLYALLGTRLVTVNTGSLAITTVASIAPVPVGTVRGLASTADSRFILFVENGLDAVIDEVDPTTGAVTTVATVKNPDPGSGFVGGVPTTTGYELVFGNNVWTFSSATLALTLHGMVTTTNDAGVAGVGTTPCVP